MVLNKLVLEVTTKSVCCSICSVIFLCCLQGNLEINKAFVLYKESEEDHEPLSYRIALEWCLSWI